MQEALTELDIAILGYGTVGSGVLEVLDTNQTVIGKKAGRLLRAKYVLDLRDFPGDPVEKILTHDIESILNDPAVKVVVEVMGGIEPAYTYVKKALQKGKSVVTSNKELVARHGAEMLEIARSNTVNFLFEASVGGGIPILRALNSSLSADEISEISGILNGTTNYILTEMARKNRDLTEVLAEAQRLGYAEKNPSADVEGMDACRKLAILLSLTTGRQVDHEDIYTEGIGSITPRDMAYARALQGTIKLLALGRIKEEQIFARVSPAIVNNDNPLAIVNDVFNAILVKGNVTGDVMFYGRGAGKLPTAGAVVADLIDCAKHLHVNINQGWSMEKIPLLPLKQGRVRKLVRVACSEGQSGALAAAHELFDFDVMINLDGVDREFAFVTEALTEGEIEEKLCRLKERQAVAGIPNTIRLYGDSQ